ncbi:MAG: hypothetical protein AAGB48_12620 [Planctomycetota bacterium]
MGSQSDPETYSLIRAELDDWQSYWNDLANASDQEIAIIGAARLDDSLDRVLQARLVDDKNAIKSMLGGRGALSAFGSRIDIAILVGVITPEFGWELHQIRKIRNNLAHTDRRQGFEHAPIRDLCVCLKFPVLVTDELKQVVTASPKERFKFTVSTMEFDLRKRVHTINRILTPVPSYRDILMMPTEKRDAIESSAVDGRLRLDGKVYDLKDQNGASSLS